MKFTATLLSTDTCNNRQCGKPLDQARTGRARLYCSDACRKEAQRARERGQKALQQRSAEKLLSERFRTLPASVVQKLLEIKRVYGVYAAWDASEACMRMIGKEIVIKL